LIGLVLTAVLRMLQMIVLVLSIFMIVISMASYVKMKKAIFLVLAMMFTLITLKPILDVIFSGFGALVLIRMHVATTIVILMLLVISYVARVRYVR